MDGQGCLFEPKGEKTVKSVGGRSERLRFVNYLKRKRAVEVWTEEDGDVVHVATAGNRRRS